jgi:hypothetical protein
MINNIYNHPIKLSSNCAYDLLNPSFEFPMLLDLIKLLMILIFIIYFFKASEGLLVKLP